ncbi:MAG: UvrD-helicase domain-containing protein, partial [Bacteroidaceae bacterium]|nr:UvrD-helicase domain-containing protein [Bacteroidaceae bacterium]
MSNYLDELNVSQREAVLYNDGPSLVIAGAGSGKTRVLTYKIAHLMELGYDPWNILALTFTNKAAREMKERIAKQVGERARYLWMGTFHSIFSRILRVEAETIGFTSNYTIYDTSDSKSLLKTIIKEKFDEAYKNLTDEEKEKYFKYYKVNLIQSRISNAKNQLIVPSVYMSDEKCKQADRNEMISLFGKIYECYCERCKQDNVMDFDDLLLYTYILFRDNPAIRMKYAMQFKYVLVDEYQDTNSAQNN